MDAPLPPQSGVIGSLGARIREARHRLGLSQDKLAAPEFTKSYISAIERSRARPSLKALELLARRLDLPMSELLAAAPPGQPGAPDLDALEEDFAYQLDHAKVLINAHQGEEALAVIATATKEYEPYLSQFGGVARYRLHRLRSLAYLRAGQPVQARLDLEQALALAQDLGDAQEVARVLNAFGAAYYDQNRPREALEYHSRCLHAIHTGDVKDLTLRLNIYSNLANDYWALNDWGQAIKIYHETLSQLADVNNLERQAALYWSLSMAYQADGGLAQAKLYAAQALSLYEAAANKGAAAQMCCNLAALLIARREYAEAEQCLARAETFLQGIDQPLVSSILYEHYAELALQRDQLAVAGDYAQRSVDLIEVVFQEQPAGAATAARGNIVRSYAQVLRVAGQVAERTGQPAAADDFFTRAIALVHSTGYAETAYEINLIYAELLVARGDHQRAADYYRAASEYC